MVNKEPHVHSRDHLTLILKQSAMRLGITDLGNRGAFENCICLRDNVVE